VNIEIARFMNVIKAQIAGMIGQQAQPRYGIVQSFDPPSYTARVMVQPENVLSGWLPIKTHWVGNGWGDVSPPSPGEQVMLIPQEGDADSYVISGRAFSAVDLPPPAPSGERWLVHQTGAFVKLLNNGQIAAQDQHGTSFTLTNDGNAVLKGNLIVEGNISTAAGTGGVGNLTAVGGVIAGYGGADQVGLQTHTHNQGNDSHGDAEVPTNAPNAGT